MADAYCRNCGVELRRRWVRWRHVPRLGPVPCGRAQPEAGARHQHDDQHDEGQQHTADQKRGAGRWFGTGLRPSARPKSDIQSNPEPDAVPPVTGEEKERSKKLGTALEQVARPKRDSQESKPEDAVGPGRSWLAWVLAVVLIAGAAGFILLGIRHDRTEATFAGILLIPGFMAGRWVAVKVRPFAAGPEGLERKAAPPGPKAPSKPLPESEFGPENRVKKPKKKSEPSKEVTACGVSEAVRKETVR